MTPEKRIEYMEALRTLPPYTPILTLTEVKHNLKLDLTEEHKAVLVKVFGE